MISKLVDEVNLMCTWSFISTKGQGNALILVQIHWDSIFSNFFSAITAVPIKTKFHREAPWDGRTNDYSIGSGHMTKLAAIPIYGNNF